MKNLKFEMSTFLIFHYSLYSFHQIHLIFGIELERVILNNCQRTDFSNFENLNFHEFLTKIVEIVYICYFSYSFYRVTLIFGTKVETAVVHICQRTDF